MKYVDPTGESYYLPPFFKKKVREHTDYAQNKVKEAQYNYQQAVTYDPKYAFIDGVAKEGLLMTDASDVSVMLSGHNLLGEEVSGLERGLTFGLFWLPGATRMYMKGGEGVSDLVKIGTKSYKFNDLAGHYSKHGDDIKNALGKSVYTADQYVDDAKIVLKAGTYVPELNAYVKLIGGKGDAKYAFVGLDDSGNITTFHLKTAKDLAKKAPSLGITY